MSDRVSVRCHVLLVEDNAGDARLIHEMLADPAVGAFVLERADGLAKALERLARPGVNAVLLDLGLPDSQGMESFVRARQSAPTTPIIVISGLDDQELALRAVRAGAQDYLVKGKFDGSLLARVLHHSIGRMDAEESLRTSEERYRLLTEASFDGVVLWVDHVLGEANQGFLDMLGYTKEEAIGRPMTDFVRGSEREVAQARASEGLEGRYEMVGMRKDGGEIRLEVAARTLDIGGRAGQVSALRDVTAHRRMEEQLRQAQKMEAVGQLAGGIAHDFNNLLTAIFGYLDFMAHDLPQGSPVLLDLKEVRKAAQRAAALTSQLLAFSRRQVLQPVVLQLNDIVAGTEKMLVRLIGEDMRLATVLAPDLGNVRADPGQIEQVIVNLVVNARDAMPHGGQLTVETANAVLSEGYANEHRPVVPGSYVMLAVSDTGTGMDAATRSRIFEPFFTTKDKSKGTGLGLATVYGIVEQSSGHVWVYSELGIGTTVKVYLPRVVDPVMAVARSVMPEAPSVGSETILVTEDDEQLRPLVRGILQRSGYTVLIAADPEEALAVAAGHPGPIHLLLTDVVMPRGTGPELAARLAKTRPETRILFMSGYADDAIVRHGVLEPGINYLAKPFTTDALARQVRQVLDRVGG